MNDELNKLYTALIGKGYTTDDIGDENTFRSMMSDKNNRKDLYDYVSERGDFRIGDYDAYEQRLTSQPIDKSQYTFTGEQLGIDDIVQEQRDKVALRINNELPTEDHSYELHGIKRGIPNSIFELELRELGERYKELKAADPENKAALDELNRQRAILIGEHTAMLRKQKEEDEKNRKSFGEELLDAAGELGAKAVGVVTAPVYAVGEFVGDAVDNVTGWDGMHKTMRAGRKKAEEALFGGTEGALALRNDILYKNGKDGELSLLGTVLQSTEEMAGGATTPVYDLLEKVGDVTGLEGVESVGKEGRRQYKENILADSWKKEDSFFGQAAQLVPQVAAIWGGIATGNPALMKAGMGIQVASSMGQAAHEAAEAGASGAQIFGASALNGIIELLTERIPLGRWLKKIPVNIGSEVVSKASTEVLEGEAEALFKEAKKRLGNKLTAKSAKEFAIDMASEGGSEFAAEFLQTLVPIIYKDAEEYPTFHEALQNGIDGLLGGIMMSGTIQPVASYTQRKADHIRRKEQGFVDVAQIKNAKDQYEVVEIVGENESGEFIGKRDNELVEVHPSVIVARRQFDYDAFRKNEMMEYSDEGYSQEPTGGNALAVANEYTNARGEVVRALGLADDDDVDAFIGDRELEEIAQGDEDTEMAITHYLQARARRDGFRERYQEERDRQFEESDKSIDGRSNNGSVYTTMLGDQQVHITGGDVVLNEDGTIDVNNSSESLFVEFPDGSKKPVTPDKFTDKVAMEYADELKVAGRAAIEEKWKAEFDNAENAYIEQQKRAEGSLFDMTDKDGTTHRVEVIKEGKDISNILLDGVPQKMSTDALNSWKQEAGIQSTENGVQSIDAVADNATDNGIPTESEANVAPTGDNVAPIVLPNVPDFFRLGGTNYEVASRNDDGSVDVMVDGKRETLPTGTDYSTHMPTDKKGEVQYEQMPVERTHEYFVQKVKDDEARAEMIEKRRKKAEAERKKFDKKPDPGIDPDAYEAKMTQWEADKKAAQAKVDYWNEVAKREAEITRSETREAVNNIKPRDVVEMTPDEFIAEHLPRITPESFKSETGLSNSEQAGLVGYIAGKDKGGMTVEEAAENILENYDSELRGLGFTGDMQDVRNAIIDILSSGNPRSYAKRGLEQRNQESIDQQRAEMETVAAQFGFSSVEEMAEYESVVVPRIIETYKGFDENEYYNNLAENYENDTTRESESIGQGGELLQGEQAADNNGAPTAGVGNQGGAVSNNVQGGGQNGTPQGNQQVSEPVGNSEQLSSSEIPNNQSVAEGDAPGQSGVYADNQGNPVDADGKLIVDEVNSIDEITDEDFETPTRNVQLPVIPENVANAIGTNGRPVVIKRNVFEKNGNTHVELEPEDSRNILRSALYNPNLVGSTQPIRRPDYKVAIRTGDQNAVVVLDVYQEKDFVEIVGWRMVNEKGLAKMQRQAEREGGQFLILSPNDGSAAALSALPLGLSSASEDINSVSNSQENAQKSGENTTLEQIKAELKDLRKKIAVNGNKLKKMLHLPKYAQLTADYKYFNEYLDSMDDDRALDKLGIIKRAWNADAFDALWAERELLKQQIKDAEERLKNAESRKEKEESTPEIQEPRSVEENLDNGDKRITSYNSRGEVATVAIERDGKVVSVDSYDEGVLFEHTEYDGNGKASSVTRYDKQGNVVGTQVYEDGKAKTPMQRLADRILDRTEEKRRIPLRERARELEAQVGVKANIIESLDEVKNREARKRIAAGEPVAGWYSGGQVYLYMPNIKDKREIELTYVHEVVAHHGVKKLLGERFNEFLDGVWNMMSEADRARMLAYVGANENPTLQDMRAAADEYVAELAEEMNLGELEQSTWDKIVDWFKELLENIGFENLTKEDIESMLKASYANLRSTEQRAESKDAQPVAKQTKAEKYRKMREDLEGLGMFGEVALPKGYQFDRVTEDAINEIFTQNGIGFNRSILRPMFRISRTSQEFDATQAEAVEKRGIVAPGLNEAVVNVIDVPRHDFTGNLKEARAKAKEWAIENYTGKEFDLPENAGKYVISKKAIGKYLDKSAFGKSENAAVHLSVLKELPNVISNSIEAEIHADYSKGDNGERSAENGVNRNDLLVHRIYGAVNIDGKTYRVKTTIYEFRDANTANTPHSYEVTKIELIEDSTVTPNDGINNPLNRSVNSISAAKLLEGVEKSYDKGKKVLVESENSSENPQDAEGGIRFRKVNDPAKIAELEAGEKMKVYRAMQVIDGKLYPPMSAKVDGKLREPIELGVWEEAEERPELADNKGYFRLDKGNKKSLKARYNPYIHTSTTPLNDQFSEAQERPNLVTVEVEIPVSELTSGYKAEKAKDAVGRLEWKAGVVQGKLSGTRTVILSRWDKPVRIVPDSEVADVIVEMFGDREIVMPSNVVTPSLRAELEKRGVPFVETNNQGKPVSARPMTKEEARQMVRELVVPFAKELREEQERAQATEDSGIRFRKVGNTENNSIFASTYKTEDGKDINYTSERTEGYGVQDDGIGNSNSGSRRSILQRQTDTGVPGADSGLDAEKGEFCVVERVFTENGAFNFTSGEKIESADDVAYIFSALEDAAKEHSFVVYVKDGMPTVIELGMGSFNATMADVPTASLAYSRINPDHVYFVHNHPSGNLICSDQDVAMLRVFEDMSDVPVTGVIINLKTGKYGTFDTERHSVIGEKRVPEKEERLAVHTLDKQIFAPDYDPMAQPLVRGSQDVAQFLNSQRMGDRPKVSFLILSRANRIIGNIHTPFTNITTDVEAVARYINERVIQFGGENAILYGDFAITSVEGMDFRLLQNAMDRFGKTKLLDVVRVEGNFTRSANDMGLLYEPEAEYKDGQTMFRTVEETTDGSIDDVPAQPLTLMERITNSLLEVSAKNKENLGLRADALRAFGRDINRVLSLMKAQREYDKSTVDTLVKLAKMYFKNAQLLGEVTPYEVARIMGVLNRSVGKRDISTEAARLMDILLDAHTNALAGILDKAEKVKAKKVNAAGVEVMGRLDKYGQKRVDEYRAAKEMTPEKLEEAIYDSDNRLAELEQRVREELGLPEGDVDQAAREYTGDNDVVNVYMDERARLEGLTLAREYKESIQRVQEEIKDLKRELKQAEEDYRLGNIDGKSLKEFRKSVAEAIMESKAGLIEGYHSLIYKFQENTKESSKRAKAFAQAQIDRAREIQHIAVSDMEGISAATQGTHPENYNNAVMNALRSPFPTLQGMLKKFGEKNVEGKGYLYERFIPQATKAGDNEFRGKVTARVMIEGKLKEIYGKKMTIAKFMKQLREYGATVTYREGNEMKQFDLTKGQMLYIYMVNKMSDGQMKLRRMGITDDVVAELMTKLPEAAVQFADWAQNELLKDLRGKYNAVHERVFGAPMAAIENYFPIKIRKEARGEKGDVSEVGQEGKPSTVTGSIIKRTKNATAIDLSADAMQVLMEHIDDLEHWAAFAEFNRDINTLINYKHFQNQVKNMTSVRYGSGTELWKNFRKTAQIVSGTYRPSDSSIDRAVQNIAKGLTRSKINFRLFTAVKQLLSAPAFWTDAGVEELAYCYANPKGSFDWALENLPGFAERWQGRTMGNEKLLKSDSDWELWRNEFVEKATRWGMTPNAAIDALTVAQGARAVYMTKLEQFKKAGYTEQRANEKALQAAAEAYNESQQSSEGIYLSPLQVEGTVASAIFSTFKNSNFGYTRKTAQAVANIKRKMRKGYKEETIAFMTKQMVRDGLSEENAKRFAEKVYNKSKYKDVANVAMFGFGLNLLWEAGGMAIYLLFGDDDEEKEKMRKEIALRGSLGLLNGIPFGETMISAAMAVKEGDTKYFRLPELVAVGDIENLAQVLNYDPVRGANDIVNMLTSMGVGVTPQVLTDILVAFGDVEELSAEELGMFVARFVNAPQSNLDRLMVDDAMENSAINAEEIMQRYAEYKKSKNAPITQFLYSDEEEQKAVERYGKRFAKLLDERLENVVEDTGTFDLFYNDTDAEMKKVLASMRKKHLAGDEADKFQKVSTKTILTNLLEGKDIENVGYYKLTNADDVDEGFVVEMQIKELKDISDELKKLKDAGDKDAAIGYKNKHSKELKLYKKLNKYQNDINEFKSKMKKKPENAERYMAKIRELRAKAIDLINEYNNE